MPSTAIDSFSYDDQTRVLRVTFTSGHRYAYKDVERGVYDDFRAAQSKGRFFRDRILGRYAYARIDDAPDLRGVIFHWPEPTA